MRLSASERDSIKCKVNHLKEVQLYTDGACSGNPGPGGWGAILIYASREKEISGYVQETTNNRMEMFAVIQGLRCLRQPCRVTVFTDSAYLANAFLRGWIDNWQRNGWKTAGKQSVQNQDLWRQLLIAMKSHDVHWVRVRGHADNEYNNRCDRLATGEIKKHHPKPEQNLNEGEKTGDEPARARKSSARRRAAGAERTRKSTKGSTN